jgi:hypothetical protein
MEGTVLHARLQFEFHLQGAPIVLTAWFGQNQALHGMTSRACKAGQCRR